MKSWVQTARTERGVALPLALFALVMLSGLLLAFLSMSGMEAEISANLTEVARARYVAEAGVEWAYDQLATNMNWNGILVGPDLNPNTVDDGLMTPGVLPAPLNNAAFGTFTATLRNDSGAGDAALTGQLACNGQGASDCAGATTDTNGVVILTAAGTYRGVTRQIQVVLRRLNLPPLPGSYSMPGTQADLWFQNSNFDIDGRDWEYKCTANCNDPNPLNRTYAYSQKADQSKMKYGIATQTGNQANLNPVQTYEQRAEFKLDNAAKRNNVIGKDQTNPAGSTTGLNTVAPVDPATPEGLNSAKMQTFLTELAKFQATKVYQSNLACAEDISGTPVGIRMIANGDDTKANLVTIKNTCGLNQEIDLGTVDKPALVYFKGDLDPTSSFAGVRTEGNKAIRGAGILIVEDGDFRVTSEFEWNGIVIVTGRYVSSIFESGGKATIYGATVANETEGCEGGCPSSGTYWDGYFQSSNTVALRFSQQALDLVQGRLLFKMSTWREL